MSRNLFSNSKAALVFAAMTIISTLMMVGSRDGGGVLDVTLDRFADKPEIIAEEAQPIAEEPVELSEPLEQLDPASGWGGTGDTEFGDYIGEEPMPAETATQFGPDVPEQSTDDTFGAPEQDGVQGFAEAP